VREHVLAGPEVEQPGPDHHAADLRRRGRRFEELVLDRERDEAADSAEAAILE
jgi:hypothetical protein